MASEHSICLASKQPQGFSSGLRPIQEQQRESLAAHHPSAPQQSCAGQRGTRKAKMVGGQLQRFADDQHEWVLWIVTATASLYLIAQPRALNIGHLRPQLRSTCGERPLLYSVISYGTDNRSSWLCLSGGCDCAVTPGPVSVCRALPRGCRLIAVRFLLFDAQKGSPFPPICPPQSLLSLSSPKAQATVAVQTLPVPISVQR